MEPWSEQQWTTLQAQHRLGVDHLVYAVSGKRLLQMQFPEATVSGVGQPGDTLVWPPEELAWAVATLAQSSAYLALALQAFAERLSTMQIACPESTYRRLYDSIETLGRLLGALHKNFSATNDNGNDGLVPVLSERLVREIRCMLAQEIVNGSGGSTISSARVTKHPT